MGDTSARKGDEKTGVFAAGTLTRECVLFLQNIFYYYKMCSLIAIEYVFLLHNPWLQRNGEMRRPPHLSPYLSDDSASNARCTTSLPDA